jgi:TonB-linked SusC/RagA family outer membrane protein
LLFGLAISILSVLMGSPVLVYGNNLNIQTVRGQIKSAFTGETLVGVTVLEVGTTNGAITDQNGNYVITVMGPESSLRFSYVGFLPETRVVGDRTRIDLEMVDDILAMEEFVVVGYGTMKRTDISTAVVSIKSEDIVTSKNQNVQNMLTGKMAGVRVVQKTSEPGVFNNHFDIRGFGAPLVVIDGVPRNDFQRLDPNEIESISVLKDGGAAIYGVRAANGVVLVTTKKGEKGAPRLSYSMYTGVQVPSNILSPVGALDRMTLMNEKSRRSVTNSRLSFPDEDFKLFHDGIRTSTDWYNIVMREYAPQQQHNVSLSGGADRIDYFVNMGYLSQDGFWRSGDLNYDRFNMRANINAKVTDRIDFSLKLSGIQDTRNSPDTDAWNIFKTLWRTVPDKEVYANDTYPYYQRMDDIDNVLAMTISDVSGFKKRENKIFNSTMELKYDVPGIEGLVARSLFSYDTRVSDNTHYRKSFKEYRFDEAKGTYTETDKNAPTKLERNYGNTNNILYQIGLNYDKSFAAKHTLNTLVLLESARLQSDNILASRHFTIPLPYLFAGDDLMQEATARIAGMEDYTSNGFVGKLHYNYASKYLFDLNARYDGSSRFPELKRWGFFPGGSIGWRITEEAFLKDRISDWADLKIRASYGKMGDDMAMDYQFISGYDYPNILGGRFNNYPTGYFFDGVYTNALGFRVAPNPYITWYTATTKNIGIDADLWNRKVGITIDYFERERDGMYASRLVSVPGTFGSPMPEENLESDLTRGIELEVRNQNRIGQLRYNVSGNIALTRTQLLYVERAPSGNSFDNWKNNVSNRYNDIWFGYGADGRYTSYEQIATSDVYTPISTLPGDYIYVDWNGDGIIDENDQYPIATTRGKDNNNRAQSSYPLVNFGVNLSAQYRNFDMNMLFQGATMYYIGMGEALRSPLLWDGNALEYFKDRWHTADPTSDPYDPSNQWIPGTYAFGAHSADYDSEFGMQSGSYVRLKNIELGYTIPMQLSRRVNINKARFYINAYNFMTFTGVKGIDPEHPSENHGYMYPLNRTVNFGAEITF